MKLRKVCECGCGNLVRKPEHRFLHRHHTPKNPEKPCGLCECGCGEFANPGCKFIRSHVNRGRKASVEVRKEMSRTRSIAAQEMTEEERKKRYGGTKGTKQSEEHRRHRSEALKGRPLPESTRQAVIKFQTGRKHTEEHNRKTGKAAKEMWERPGFKEEMGKKFSKSLMGHEHSEETRQKIRERATGREVSEETRQKQSLMRKGVPKSKEWRESMSGEGNPAWAGGGSYEPYPMEFNNLLKEEIRKRDNHQCQNPSCRGTAKRIAVHHIDYNKLNCDPENLITVCTSCNSRANEGREFWTAFYKKLMRGRKLETEMVGNFLVDLADVSMASYNEDDEAIWFDWKDPNKPRSAVTATKDEFIKLQSALANVGASSK